MNKLFKFLRMFLFSPIFFIDTHSNKTVLRCHFAKKSAIGEVNCQLESIWVWIDDDVLSHIYITKKANKVLLFSSSSLTTFLSYKLDNAKRAHCQESYNNHSSFSASFTLFFLIPVIFSFLIHILLLFDILLYTFSHICIIFLSNHIPFLFDIYTTRLY